MKKNMVKSRPRFISSGMISKLSTLAAAISFSLVSSSALAVPAKADHMTDDWLHVEGNQIVSADGTPVRLTGAEWFGFNGDGQTLHGLWSVNMVDTIKNIADRGINTLRIPVSTELLLEWKQGLIKPESLVATHINPDLAGLNSLEVFDALLAAAKTHGVKILLEVASAENDISGFIQPLWYRRSINSEMFYQAWEWVAERYKHDDTIIAFDLEKQPHGKPFNEVEFAKWDDSTDENNWKHVCETASKRILDIHPNILLMCQGVQAYPKDGQTWTSKNEEDYEITWWGANLMGVKDHPIDLGERQAQFLYGTSDQGPNTFVQAWFDKDFSKESLFQDLWQDKWMYIHDQGTAPIFITQWGGFLDGENNEKWLNILRDFIVENKLSHSFQSINPNSGDTGGLLLNDWKTWDEDKYALLEPSLWQNSAGQFIGLDHQIALGSPSTGISLGAHQRNLLVAKNDVDGDGIPNMLDNCINVANPAQWDNDKDGIGNACDSDYDHCKVWTKAIDGQPNDALLIEADCDPDDDLVIEPYDNCPSVANPGQWDKDKDGIGNACDLDIDGDGCANDIEDALGTKKWQKDSVPDVCEMPTGEDSDNDGIVNHLDNCPTIANEGQWDKDNDGLGNECDDDIDGDGCPNDIEDALGTKKWQFSSVPVNCESISGNDEDSDGIIDESDNCPLIANPGQWDKDADGIGNVCDDDIDGDGYSNADEKAAGTKVWNAEPPYPAVDSDVIIDGDLLTVGQGDKQGHTLYTNDCGISCSSGWWPLIASADEPSGTEYLGTVTRAGGESQVTYQGKPLYYSMFDNAPGETNGLTIDGWQLAEVAQLNACDFLQGKAFSTKGLVGQYDNIVDPSAEFDSLTRHTIIFENTYDGGQFYAQIGQNTQALVSCKANEISFDMMGGALAHKAMLSNDFKQLVFPQGEQPALFAENSYYLDLDTDYTDRSLCSKVSGQSYNLSRNQQGEYGVAASYYFDNGYKVNVSNSDDVLLYACQGDQIHIHKTLTDGPSTIFSINKDASVLLQKITDEQGRNIHLSYEKEYDICPDVMSDACVKVENKDLACIDEPCPSHIFESVSSNMCGNPIEGDDVVHQGYCDEGLEGTLTFDDPTVKLTDKLPKAIWSPTLVSSSITDDILSVFLGYSGCADNTESFDLYLDNSWLESYPAQVNARFIPKNNELFYTCQMFVQSELTYDLLPLKQRMLDAGITKVVIPAVNIEYMIEEPLCTDLYMPACVQMTNSEVACSSDSGLCKTELYQTINTNYCGTTPVFDLDAKQTYPGECQESLEGVESFDVAPIKIAEKVVEQGKNLLNIEAKINHDADLIEIRIETANCHAHSYQLHASKNTWGYLADDAPEADIQLSLVELSETNDMAENVICPPVILTKTQVFDLQPLKHEMKAKGISSARLGELGDYMPK